MPFNENLENAHLDICRVNEYTLFKAYDHPIHIHVNHFQLPAILNETIYDNDYFQPCDYHETFLWLRKIGHYQNWTTLTVRQYLVDFPGPWAVHCHIIHREDVGMMGILGVEVAESCQTATRYLR